MLSNQLITKEPVGYQPLLSLSDVVCLMAVTWYLCHPQIFISSHSLSVIFVKIWYSGWDKNSPRGHSGWVKILPSDTPVGVKIYPMDPFPLPVLRQSAHLGCHQIGLMWQYDHNQDIMVVADVAWVSYITSAQCNFVDKQIITDHVYIPM